MYNLNPGSECNQPYLGVRAVGVVVGERHEAAQRDGAQGVLHLGPLVAQQVGAEAEG
jgi:hypothetical protein